MTPQELKNSILQLAIQGKLVEQRPEEGTAEELYKQIQAEKQALIKAGKLKKEKPLPEISEDEKPFDIPESWKWVRIVSIVTLNPKNELPDELDTAFIPMPCVSDGYRNEHTYEIQKWGSIKKGFTHFADKDINNALFRTMVDGLKILLKAYTKFVFLENSIGMIKNNAKLWKKLDKGTKSRIM